MKNLYLICLLFIISACGTPTTEDRITFTQVDPFLKVFRESNFFPEYDETEEVAAGEHATFQFAVRAALPLKELSAQVTAFTNEKGTQLQSSPRFCRLCAGGPADTRPCQRRHHLSLTLLSRPHYRAKRTIRDT